MQRQYRRADYTVGWICALPVELAAAQLMLDETHPDLEPGATGDDNLYVLGTIRGHNVVIGCLPAGQTGTSSAAVVATQMLATFRKIRFGLMVGIGGGVPSVHADIRLGDVVVSQPNGTFGGVVQYDMGKTTINGVQRTGALNSPPQVLLNALSSVQASEWLGKSGLLNYTSRLEDSKKFQRSRVGQDVLYDADYNHENPRSRTCVWCSPNKIQSREPRQPEEEILVHYGTIASGNQVMKNALERDRASAQLGGVLCFEMEAAGLMNTFPCLVIRGICDYSDSHKSKRWQPYAAGVAAAYAKEVLSVIRPIEVADTQIAFNDVKLHSESQMTQANCTPQPQQNECDITTLSSTSDVDLAENGYVTNSESSPPSSQSSRNRLSETASHRAMFVKQALSDEQRQKIEDSLHFQQRDARLLTLRLAQTRTCQWLLNNSKYKDWLHVDKINNHHPFFWIKGKPGSGKSIMMKFLFSNAKKVMSDSLVISFFFNARGGELEKTTSGLYRALLLQLLQKAPQTWTAFADYDDLEARLNFVKQFGWQDEVLRQVFVRCLQRLESKRVICYVDALDECPEAAIRDMISFFEAIGELASTSDFRVCLSSRHYPEISIRNGLQLVLEAEAEHIEDIARYIDANLNLNDDPQFGAIKTELMSKASGIFLWVHLVIPVLNKAYDSGRIKALQIKLARMPVGLHELFADMVTRDKHRLGHFRLCVEIILFAAGPLEPNEFRIAVEACSDSSAFDMIHNLDSMNPQNLRKFVLDCSKGPAEITESRVPTVQWIHESIRDFLLSENGLSRLETPQQDSQDVPRAFSGHNIFIELYSRQIRYITKQRLRLEAEEKLDRRFPFLKYAVQTILHHLNEAYKIDQDEASIDQLLDTALNLGYTSNAIRDAMHEIIFWPFNTDLIRIVVTKAKRHIETKNAHGLTPLLWALQHGKKTHFKIFLDAGANQCRWRFEIFNAFGIYWTVRDVN